MTGLRDLPAKYPVSGWQHVARLIVLLLAALIAWANFALLDEVTIAQGEVVPEGKVKMIQHLEGGIVREIHVREGAVVKEGDPLIQIELPTLANNREEMQVRMDGLKLSRARLQAEANHAPLVFPDEEAKRRPDLVMAEKRVHEARARELESTLAVLNEQMRQRALEVQELKARQRSSSNNLRLTRQKVAMSRDLLSQGLTARMEHVQLESDLERIQGELEALDVAVPRGEAAVAESKERQNEERQKVSREAESQLGQVELDIARIRELLSEATSQFRRAQITSPIDGIVKNLQQHTIGGVIRPGEPIMEIVPVNERLLVEAKLNPADRGYVTAGQKAVVKVTAYDFTRYGGLDGNVILVAPDTTVGADGQPFYRMLVETDRAHLGATLADLPITPGMQATVDVHTGTRTVIEYLMKPVLKLRGEAFRER
ncbi:MAG: HlyD family type I secretion periplasmic adaptor subunit [Alphaproteobacteria bacterium]|nr:HlyD family type I secretion periplasmic adaptor subunit [Alphaproteobacteria bacterium]